MDVYVARQPIFDRYEHVAGYELLYRNTATSTTAGGAAAEAMCTDTVVHAFLDIGLSELTDGKRAFINCTREFVLDGQVELLPPSGVIVELLETVGYDEPILAACHRLREKGYTLALDDYVYHPSHAPILRAVHLAKIDVLRADDAQLREVCGHLAPFGLTLVAERVEHKAMHDTCMEMGFSLFQGYYYRRPELITRQEIEVQQGGMIRLLNLLMDTDASDVEIENGFRADPTLTYKLLRIVNSAAVGGRGVDSIPFAIRMVGRQMLYRWLSLLMVSSMVTGNGVRDQHVYAALLRARLCELIAEASPDVRYPQTLFMAGLFSKLDTVLRMPLDDLMARVHVSDEIRAAVLRREGPYAITLLFVEAYEDGDWDMVDKIAERLGLMPAQLPWLYTKALTWVNEQLATMHAAA